MLFGFERIVACICEPAVVVKHQKFADSRDKRSEQKSSNPDTKAVLNVAATAAKAILTVTAHLTTSHLCNLSAAISRRSSR